MLLILRWYVRWIPFFNRNINYLRRCTNNQFVHNILCECLQLKLIISILELNRMSKDVAVYNFNKQKKFKNLKQGSDK